MIIYSGTKQQFVDEVINDTIAAKIEDILYKKLGRRTGTPEFHSWENSLQYMEKVLNDGAVPQNAGVAIEYNVPMTAMRVDFIISGYAADGTPHVVIIELKQWSEMKVVDNADAIVEYVETYTGGAPRQVVHPSYQAWSYSMLIQDYNQTVQDEKISMHPCAYLHNYRRKEANDPLDDYRYRDYLLKAPAYTKGDAVKLREFIAQFVHTGDDVDLIYRIDGGKIRPSKSLQDAIAGMMKGNKEFYMLDDQKLAYEKILLLAAKSKRDEKKRTVIVEGGPGTGKSVIAINLLAELTGQEQVVQYSSKNSAPRDVYCKKLAGTMGAKRIKAMFQGSGSYTSAESGIVDTILCDEAHRLNAKSGMFSNLGENQIKEIIHAAKCSVFFIDESQRVTMKDIGSVEEIRSWAKLEGSEVTCLQLTSQFRCNGSDGYLAWLDDVLQIRKTANFDITELDYDFRVFDSPALMVEAIKAKNELDHRSRVVAGYCWKWPKEGKGNPDYHDIKIGNFEMSWNLSKGDYSFALDDDSIDQAGCIHTTQGLEFGYVGVIIGEDLICRDGTVQTDYTKRASTDQSIKGLKTLMKNDPAEGRRRADEIIKNTYRTLMSRGMKGCYVYCCDQELAQYMKERVPAIVSSVTELRRSAGTQQPISIVPKKFHVFTDRPETTDVPLFPIVGEIAAGHERIMDEYAEGWLAANFGIVGRGELERHFYLRVTGDSMIGEDIHDGDLVLIRRTSKPRNGDIVACMVGGDRATLKTLHITDEAALLEPANPDYEPIKVPWYEFAIGDAKIIGVLRDIVSNDDVDYVDPNKVRSAKKPTSYGTMKQPLEKVATPRVEYGKKKQDN